MIDCQYCQDKICKHDHVRWLKLCPEAKAEAEAIQKRWDAERLNPPKPAKIIYHGQAKAQHEKELREELT